MATQFSRKPITTTAHQPTQRFPLGSWVTIPRKITPWTNNSESIPKCPITITLIPKPCPHTFTWTCLAISSRAQIPTAVLGREPKDVSPSTVLKTSVLLGTTTIVWRQTVVTQEMWFTTGKNSESMGTQARQRTTHKARATFQSNGIFYSDSNMLLTKIILEAGTMMPKWLVKISDHQVRPQTWQGKSNTPLRQDILSGLKIIGVKIMFFQGMLLLKAITLQTLMYIIMLILATINNVRAEIAAKPTVATKRNLWMVGEVPLKTSPQKMTKNTGEDRTRVQWNWMTRSRPVYSLLWIQFSSKSQNFQPLSTSDLEVEIFERRCFEFFFKRGNFFSARIVRESFTGFFHFFIIFVNSRIDLKLMNIPYVREYSKPLPVNIGIAWYSIVDGENIFLWKPRIKILYF